MNRQEIVYQIINQHYNQNFEALVKRVSGKIGPFWAEDCVHDTYERAYRYWERLPLGFVGINYYLSVMLTNRIRDYQSDRIDSVEIEEYHWESGELADEIRAVGILSEVKAHLATYPEEQKSIIYLRLFQGEKQELVSSITGVTQAWISQLCSKFQREVKEKYSI